MHFRALGLLFLSHIQPLDARLRIAKREQRRGFYKGSIKGVN